MVPRGTFHAVPSSTESSKWSIHEVASAALHVIATVPEARIVLAAGDVIDAAGGVVSTTTRTRAEAEWPARSNAVTWNVWPPSARSPNVYVVVVIEIGAPPSTPTS